MKGLDSGGKSLQLVVEHQAEGTADAADCVGVGTFPESDYALVLVYFFYAIEGPFVLFDGLETLYHHLSLDCVTGIGDKLG
jgi:hypothetical protein